MTDPASMTTGAAADMPWIVYGTAWKKERTADLVVRAVSAGFRGIDTAGQPKHYDEAGVGAALDRLRQDGIGRESLFLQTKFTPLPGQDPRQVPYDINAPIEKQVAQSFESSRRNLRTDYIDAFILHSPLAPYAVLLNAWRAMESIHQGGQARHLGISNCYDPALLKRLWADAAVKPVVLQNRFYRDTGYDAAMRRWGANHGVIYQSFWTLTANPHVLASGVLRGLAGKYGKTVVQIFFRYLNQTGIVPLTGTCSDPHMREDLTVFDIALTAEELTAIERLLT